MVFAALFFACGDGEGEMVSPLFDLLGKWSLFWSQKSGEVVLCE